MLDCGHEPSEHLPITTGYGRDAEGRTFCYECAARMDRESMIETGKATLYLVERPSGILGTFDPVRRFITNWPESLEFPIGRFRKGKHSIARTRYDAWFTGPDGKQWHAVQYGENTQIAHCQRVKSA